MRLNSVESTIEQGERHLPISESGLFNIILCLSIHLVANGRISCLWLDGFHCSSALCLPSRSTWPFLYHRSEPHSSEVRSPYDSVCIFLRITGAELLFLDLWSIRLSAFEKYLFIFQSCLEFGYFLFYHCTSELLTHSGLINTLSSIKIAKFFCHEIIGQLITLWIISFTEKNFLI